MEEKFDLEKFPALPGVYLMKNASGDVLYVGKAKHLKKRIKQYFLPSGDKRAIVPFLTAQVSHIDTIVVPTEKEALLLENTLIKRHQPKYNALLKDDKTFVSLMINHQHKWPMIRLVRYKGKPKTNGLYFGPYTSAYAAKQTYELLTRLFPLRQCSDEELKRRTRPCLLYSIKRCIAPCVGKCSKEEYETFVEGAIRFLKGEDKAVLKELHREMQRASDQMEFEKAAALLKTIRQIEHVTQTEASVTQKGGKDCDALALYRRDDEVILMQMMFREGHLVGSEHYSFSHVAENDEELLCSFILQHYQGKPSLPPEILVPIRLAQGSLLEEILPKPLSIQTPQRGEKKALIRLAEENAKAAFQQEKDHQELKEKMLLDLQEKLFLNRYPKRIECFDTSNISGSDLVASMVAFTDGERDKKRMRLFKIKGIHKGDDYGALRQVLSRRLTRAKEEEDLPDLVIVDGGKGQLNTALEVFKELDIASVDLIALTKEEGRHDRGITKERVFIPERKEPIELAPTSSLMFFLQKVRDEAHRTAIGFHRKKRSTRMLTSSLDALEGIGPAKRAKLLRHFGSVKQIKQASEEQLRQVKGLTKNDIAILLLFAKDI